VLLGQEFKEQASGMKGSSLTTGHEPMECTKQLITLMVKTMFPIVCIEIYRKKRKDRGKKHEQNEKKIHGCDQPSVATLNARSEYKTILLSVFWKTGVHISALRTSDISFVSRED